MFDRMARHAVEGLAQRLHARREALGLSQAEVAKRMGGDATDVQVSHYERGRRSPAAAALKDLARALECSADHLLGMDEIVAPKPPQAPATPPALQALNDGAESIEDVLALARAQGKTWHVHRGKAYALRRSGWEPVI